MPSGHSAVQYLRQPQQMLGQLHAERVLEIQALPPGLSLEFLRSRQDAGDQILRVLCLLKRGPRSFHLPMVLRGGPERSIALAVLEGGCANGAVERVERSARRGSVAIERLVAEEVGRQFGAADADVPAQRDAVVAALRQQQRVVHAELHA